jgi:hypothetical protein
LADQSSKLNLSNATAWRPPADWMKITAVDSHTGGEPFRVIMGGVEDLEGETILSRRRFAMEKMDE